MGSCPVKLTCINSEEHHLYNLKSYTAFGRAFNTARTGLIGINQLINDFKRCYPWIFDRRLT
jgi:hypothetical protein